jgi:hypothetical protein
MTWRPVRTGRPAVAGVCPFDENARAMNPVEAYFTELRDIRVSGGVPETSGYPALSSLLNEMGHKLKPRVRCTINPKNAGAIP